MLFTILGITWGNVSILFTILGITWVAVPMMNSTVTPPFTVTRDQKPFCFIYKLTGYKAYVLYGYN